MDEVINNQEALMEALVPDFTGKFLVVEVPYWNRGRVQRSIVHDLRSTRSNATRYANYEGLATSDMATYSWDKTTQSWVLLDLVVKGMHKDNFPWRRKRKKAE